MNEDMRNNELFRASHLMIFISFTIFSVILIGESFVLSWEKWAVILIIVGILAAWFLHIRQNPGENTRLWIYSLLMMVTYFYYGIHETSTFDICAVMLAVIMLYTMTGIRPLIGLCQLTFFLTFAFDLLSVIYEGEEFGSLLATRSMLHAGLILMAGWIGRTITDRWGIVLGTSGKEIGELKELTRRLSDFLANVSHEIRTPINAVLGMNEMILRESADGEIREYALNIQSAGKTLLSLINSILDFSKIEDGKMELVPVKYDTASFINDLYNSIIQRADAKGLAFVLEVDETLPCALIGDDVRFSQVIMNLTGIGIREEDRERLFESFERLDEVRNHNIEGTGLGISIVTSLLDMMGSRLIVDSTYGEGSVFSFTIEQEVSDSTPIGNYEKRLRESSTHKDKEDLIIAPCAKILVVDDNGMNLKVARNLLKLCGIRPDEAASGQEAVELMRQII